MPKKHRRPIPLHLLRHALELLGFDMNLDHPQQTLIDRVDNYRFPCELHEATGLPMQDCARILHLRDIATGGECKIMN